MGDYNPDAPVIGGNEFIGIREELVSFSIAANTREVGCTLNLNASRTLGTGRFYIDHFPESVVTNQPVMIGVYPKGQEGYTGPIQSCVIPVISGAVTGATLSGASTVQDAVFNAANAGRIAFTPNGTVQQANVHFNTTAYAQTLVNKRILQVNVLYGLYGDMQLAVDANSSLALNVQDASSTVPYNQALDGDSASAQSTLIRRVSLGEVNPYWNVPTNVLTTSEQLPWTMQQLLHFDNAATNPYAVWFRRPASATGTGQLNLTYCALEVIYCEEARVAYGCARFGSSRGVAPFVIDTPLTYGMNAIPLHVPITMTTPILPAGSYTVMINQPDGGDISGLKSQGSVIEINALRMLYALPAHQGVETSIPWPPSDSIGQTFDANPTLIVPQVSLHLTSGAVTPEVQVYGRQIAGPAYGNGAISVSQFIDKTNLQSATNFYSQSRHYIRRFGNTQQPLVFNGVVSLTPAQFDALPEIVDGWKEVTLNWAPFFIDTSGANPAITIQDSGLPAEAAGNRWEILGVDAPALSGTAGNLFNTVPSGQLLDSATYLEPNGATADMFWASPATSGAASGDTSADMCFLISTTPPAPTVSGSVIQAQPLPILFDCPTLVVDHFNRTTASGLGVPDTGGAAYTNTGGTATDYSTTPGAGQHLSSSNAVRVSTLPGSTADGSISGYVYQPALAGGSMRQGISLRANASGTQSYSAIINTTALGVQSLIILRRNSGETDLDSMVLPWTWAADRRVALKLVVLGTTITAYAYREDQTEVQMITTQDSALTSGGPGLYSQQLSGSIFNKNLQWSDIVVNGLVGATPKAIPSSISYVHLTWANFALTGAGFGYYEVQRQDDLDASWETIAKITNQATTQFDDYEARVGVQSQYRIRIANAMAFLGPFTNFTPVTIPAPGVTGTNVINGVMIFTSNAGGGAMNVAYTPSWDGNPAEDFVFPESTRTQLQWMYGKNFMNAFSPTERGGEQFSRTILIQNSAAAGPVVEGAFRTLRDLGWAQLPYVCVRNDIGDRWFANVEIAGGSFTRNRQLGIAQVFITETSDTPYQVQL